MENCKWKFSFVEIVYEYFHAIMNLILCSLAGKLFVLNPYSFLEEKGEQKGFQINIAFSLQMCLFFFYIGQASSLLGEKIFSYHNMIDRLSLS